MSNSHDDINKRGYQPNKNGQFGYQPQKSQGKDQSNNSNSSANESKPPKGTSTEDA